MVDEMLEGEGFVADGEPVPMPVRSVGVTAALSVELEKLAVGESGYVTAKLSTVRTLIARHTRAHRAEYDRRWSELVAGGIAQGVAKDAYTKQFVAREIPGGKVRVWRVQ